MSINISQRPPQLIAISFDNCLENTIWQSTIDFSREMKKQGLQLPFTYFLSAIVLLSDDAKKLYQGPDHKPGQADIDFGGTKQDLLDRIDRIQTAYHDGHEIASHACGHFHADDEKWSQQDWDKELKLYYSLLANLLQNNQLPPEASLGFIPAEVIRGFRAPYLGVTKGLRPALAANGFLFDASYDNDADYWPKKIQGLWNMALANIKVVGTGYTSLSMDYNFYFHDSGGEEVSDPDRLKQFRERMVDSYLKYFQDNYTGNRAPLRIGHHFQQYNNGAYWLALQDFVKAVADKPEVKFVTYSQLMQYLEGLPEPVLASLQNNQVDDAAQPDSSSSVQRASQNKSHLSLAAAFAERGVVRSCGCGAIGSKVSRILPAESTAVAARAPLPGCFAQDLQQVADNGVSKPVVKKFIASPNHSSRNGAIIRKIVLHCTEFPLESVLETFQDPTGARTSAHYVIDRNGDIYQMVHDSEVANHCKGANQDSIGIEHVAKPTEALAPEQSVASANLVRWLLAEYSILRSQVFGHDFTPGYSSSTSCPDCLFGPEHDQNLIALWVATHV